MKFNSYIHNEYMKCVYWDLIFIQIGHKICQFVNILMFLANSCSESHHFSNFMAYSWVNSVIKEWNLKILSQMYSVFPFQDVNFYKCGYKFIHSQFFQLFFLLLENIDSLFLLT